MTLAADFVYMYTEKQKIQKIKKDIYILGGYYYVFTYIDI